MNSFRLNGRHIAILATDGYEQSELVQTKRLLEEAGAVIDVIAPGPSTQIRGWSMNDWADLVTVDVMLQKAHQDDYDALVLPGGVINPDKLRLEETAIAFIKSFAAAGKLIAAICHGPWTLIDAGLVKDRQITSWPSLRKDLENAGAHWKSSEVVRDGELITSRRPEDIPAFTHAITNALAQL